MNTPKKPIVIIQFSCDPYILYNKEALFDKEIESKRLKSDLIARHNAVKILKHAPKRKRIRKTIKQIILNKVAATDKSEYEDTAQKIEHIFQKIACDLGFVAFGIFGRKGHCGTTEGP